MYNRALWLPATREAASAPRLSASEPPAHWGRDIFNTDMGRESVVPSNNKVPRRTSLLSFFGGGSSGKAARAKSTATDEPNSNKGDELAIQIGGSAVL